MANIESVNQRKTVLGALKIECHAIGVARWQLKGLEVFYEENFKINFLNLKLRNLSKNSK